MSQLSQWLHWRHVWTLTLVLAAPAAGGNALCEVAVAVYYAGYDAPNDVADAYAASKAAFDHTIRKGNKALIAALRFHHEMLQSSDGAPIAEVAQAINAATAAASDADKRAETARALWIALEAGESEYSTLEALNIEHAAFMAAAYFSRASKRSLDEFTEATMNVAISALGPGKVIDVIEVMTESDSIEGIYGALASLEAAGLVGIAEFTEAFRVFHEAVDAAFGSANAATVTLETVSSFAACQDG